MNGPTDSAERARLAARDPDAFRELVRDVYPTLRRWALARTGDPDDADEVVQRTLIRMHRNLHRFSGRSKLTTWLYRILSNAATDLERSRGSRATASVDDLANVLEEETEDPVRSIHAHRMAGAVAEFLDALPSRQREVLELVDHQGLRSVDVAEMLDIEPGSVRANLFKARRAVRRAILARFPELTEGYET